MDQIDMPELAEFTPPRMPDISVIEGAWARLERLDADRHAAPLFRAVQGHDDLWDYMPYGPFSDLAAYHDWTQRMQAPPDPAFYAIIDSSSHVALGLSSFLRIEPAHGSVEIGHILLGPALQRSRLASAALIAMIRWAFDAGYRRVEWKCNARNRASRRAALRLGFTFEGVFRQHMIIKGRNRDSAWFSITDGDWRQLRAAHDRWLSPANFDATGAQIERLSHLTAAALPGRRDG